MSVSITAKVTPPPLFDPDLRQYSPLCLNSSSIANVTTSVSSIGPRSRHPSTPSPSSSAYHYQVAFFASEDHYDASRAATTSSMTSAKTQQMPTAPPQPNHRKQPSVGSNKAVNPPPKKPSSGRRSARPPSAAGDDSSRNSVNEQQPEQLKPQTTKQQQVTQQPTPSPQLGGKQRNRRVKSSDPLTTINSFQQQTQQSPQQQSKKANGKNAKSEQHSPNGDNSRANSNHSNSDSEKNERNGSGRKKGHRNLSPPSPPESVLTSAQRSMVMQQPLSDEPRAPARRRLSAPDIAAFRTEEYARPGVNQELYAGATFQNSPAASALPLPVFSTRGAISRPVDHPISALSSSLNGAPPAVDANNFNAQAQQFQQPSPFLVMTSTPQMPYGAVPINSFARHNGDGMRLSHSYTEPTGASTSKLSSSARKFSDETTPSHPHHQLTYSPMHHPFMHMANLHNLTDTAAPSRSPSIRRVALNDMSNSEQGLFAMEDEAEAARELEERRKKSRDLMSLLTGVSAGGEASRNSFPSAATQPMSVVTSAQGKLGSSLPTTPQQTTPPVDLMQISRDLKDMLRITG